MRTLLIKIFYERNKFINNPIKLRGKHGNRTFFNTVNTSDEYFLQYQQSMLPSELINVRILLV